jgi:hypothetical protein
MGREGRFASIKTKKSEKNVKFQPDGGFTSAIVTKTPI